MFNLLMSNIDWTSGRATVPKGRRFEYSDDYVSDQFRQDGNVLLDRLGVGRLGHLQRNSSRPAWDTT